MDREEALRISASESYQERYDAASALARYPDHECRERLREVVANDPNTWVTQQMAATLVRSGRRHNVEDLFAAVARAEDWESRDFLLTEIAGAHRGEDVDLTEVVLALERSADPEVAAGAREVARKLAIENDSPRGDGVRRAMVDPPSSG